MDETYRIRVRGHLDDRWSDWLGGLDIRRQDDGTTLLVGPLVDQSALHGVLACIRDLALPLLAVEGATQSDESTPEEGRGGAGGSE
jgi:hypothetical protein